MNTVHGEIVWNFGDGFFICLEEESDNPYYDYIPGTYFKLINPEGVCLKSVYCRGSVQRSDAFNNLKQLHSEIVNPVEERRF